MVLYNSYSEMIRSMLKLSIGGKSFISVKTYSVSTESSKLNGKVAIVTASTEGIGYAIARRLANDGASVVVCSRKEHNVLRAVTELRREEFRVEGVVCHVESAEQRKKLFDVANARFGGIDILVSNAAVNPAVTPVLETEEHIWDKIFRVNVKSSWLLAKEAYPYLVNRRGGNIVFISSIAGYKPMSPIGPYSVSKTTLIGLTKAIAQEVATDNIRVNCVAPGVIDTKFASILTSSEELTNQTLSKVPMKRLGEPSEVAAAVAFLVSDDASYVTGETILVTGGVHGNL